MIGNKRSRYSNYGRKPSKDFGDYLRKWREDASLTLEQAAPLLGLECKRAEGYLSQIETGKKAIPEAVLLNVPRVYKVPAEEVLRRAYWPQMYLSLLTAIMEPTELPKSIEDFLEDIEKRLEEKEKRELTRYAALLLLRREIAAEH
jgi:transcriptional regulator with XRE-family HTH domain